MVTVLGPVGVLAPAGAVTKPAADKGGSDRTSATEARRVDSVPTPKLDWRDCAVSALSADGAQCTAVHLPLDYDEPNGVKTKVALLRLPARDQAHRLGTLFVNPKLYFPMGYKTLDDMLSELMILTEPADARSRAAEAERSKVVSAFVARLKAEDGLLEEVALSLETYNSVNSVSCTDGVSAPDASRRVLVAAAAAADKRVKHFGRLGVWKSAACGSKSWTVRDEDAYRGPFNRRTAAPILVVANKWDPSTNYEGAVRAASLLPNSRLLSSDSWGHTARRSSRVRGLRHRHLPAHPCSAGAWHGMPRRGATLPGQPRQPDRPAELRGQERGGAAVPCGAVPPGEPPCSSERQDSALTGWFRLVVGADIIG